MGRPRITMGVALVVSMSLSDAAAGGLEAGDSLLQVVPFQVQVSSRAPPLKPLKRTMSPVAGS